MLRRSICLAITLSIGVAGAAARAGGLDDAQAGLEALHRGDYDAAIRLTTRALDEGGLSAQNRWVAYYNRGLAYHHEGRYDQAIADYDSAIEFNPDIAELYLNRGSAHELQGQYEQAIADDDAALRLRPDEAAAYRNRGFNRFALGNFAAAAADFERTVKLDPSDPYGVLWLHLVRGKLGKADREELSRNAAKIDRGKWPAPIVGLYLDERSPEQIRAAAAASDVAARQGRRCEAAFYIGEYELLRRNTGAGQRLLEEAVDACPHEFHQYAGALAELKRLRG